jgi:hypothetical protein
MWETIQASTDQLVYFVLGAAATTLFLIRIGLMMAGIGDADHGGDFGTDIPGDSDFGHGHADHTTSSHTFQVFSLLSILAFFMGAGWAGLAARLSWDWSPGASAGAAVVFGVTCMFLAAWLIRSMRRLEAAPVMDLRACIGSVAQVYLNIPARGQGQGQVRVNVQGRSRIVAASSAAGALAAFTSVKVLSVQPDNSLVVEAQP